MSNLKVMGIIRYPRLFTPKAFDEGSEAKYSAEFMIAKNDPTLPALQAEFNAVLQNGFPSGLPPRGTVCLEDCQVKYPDKPELASYMVLKANAGLEYKPEVIMEDLSPVMDPAQVRTGQIVWAAITIASFTQGSKGVKAYLNAVMVTPHMGPIPEEVLSARQSAASIFAGTQAPAPMAQGAAQVAPTVPTPATAVAPVPPPAAPTPPPAAPTPPPAQPSTVHQMTTAAQGATYEAMIAAGWTDETLISNGMMLPPGGVTPSFV